MVLRALKGVNKACFLKKFGSRKILAGLKVSEAFVIGLKVSFSGDFVSWGLKFFEPWSRGLKKSQIYHSIPLLKCEDSKVKLNQATRC